MRDTLGESLKKLKWFRISKTRMSAVLLILSLVVSFNVFWILRQPGLTLAGDASCKIPEHTHDESCSTAEEPCIYEEHIHQIECYADETADVESQVDWQEMFADYPYTGDLRQDLAGIAQTQVGYRESSLNFEVDSDGIRRGYTRYGAWYGAPYADWSAMFVSFCLHYAGADPNETPGNTGAASMAELWQAQGKYAAAGEYTPCSGDLVFFANNTVGIITEVQNATIYAIRGDVDNAVRGEAFSLSDESIAGWGTTEGTTPIPESSPVETEPPDISDGPVVTISADSKAEMQMRQFLLRASPRETVIDLLTYLKSHKGNHFYTLTNTNNEELPKDANGHYIVNAGTMYKLTLTINNPDGFLPGTYQYQIPNGVQVNGGIGSFILEDGTNIGDWEVSDDGLITMVFNENSNNHADVTISAQLGIIFPQQEDPLKFDGNIIVTIEPPVDEDLSTKLNKWGEQGDAAQEKDPSKIYWTVEIIGNKDSNIPGSIITDQIKSGDHRYTQSDMDGGLSFGAGHYDLETGEQIGWYAWDVSTDDPNLTWTENGWSYKMPEVVQSYWYNDPITLGNEGWIYYIKYTSTPTSSPIPGTYSYSNSLMVDGQYMQGWAEFTHGAGQDSVIKHGSFHGDADSGFFLWEFQATVPGRKEGERAAYYTQIMDHLRVKDAENVTVAYVHNDADHATVHAGYNGKIVTVPHVKDATPEDQLAWVVGWTSENNGTVYTQALLPLHRCDCTADTCHYWDGAQNRCGAFHYETDEWGYGYSTGFCYCWTPEESVTFTFSYQTDDPALIEAYGGQKKDLQNEAILQSTVYQPDGSESTVTIGSAVANVPIPGVFKKELTHDFNGYTAHYNITVNEAMLPLTNGAPLNIHDEMTQTLAYISGSLIITTEDANGNTATLRQGTDYTVTYDGTGSATDKHGNPVHVLDIVILHPQPIMYTLDYDATLIIPEHITSSIKYSNSATITLWGKDITDDSTEKVYAAINVAAKRYRVEMFKTSSLTGEPLGGATFGLFNQQGGLIATDETAADGKLIFQTNIIEGIILREHVLYYMQELDAPDGYRLDDTKYWFFFCSNTGNSCQNCDAVMAGLDAARIPFDQLGKVHATNELLDYDLPATGGPGIYPFVLVGVIFIVTPLVYGSIRRRKQERRGVG